MHDCKFICRTTVLTLFFAVISSILLGQTPRSVPVTYSSTIARNYTRSWTATAPEQSPAMLVTRALSDVKQVTQYYDGLGRPLQTVAKLGSLITGGTAADIISPIEYDLYGRETFSYLPTPSTATDATKTDGNFKLDPFAEQATFYNSASSLSPLYNQNETFFYGKNNVEASALNRPVQTFAPGNSWVGTESSTNKSKKLNYYVNTALDSVMMWTVTDNTTTGSFGAYSSPGTYPANQLFKTISIDENNNQVVEFKDTEGKVVLKKVQLSTQTGVADDGTGRGYAGWISTYYIYDVLGQLRCVLQPRGVELIVSNWALTDVNILAEQCFRYEYDARQRMIMKKVPGAVEIYMVYDARDRLVMTQDANMRRDNKWMVSIYNDWNQLVKTGMLLNDFNKNTFAAHLAAAYTSITYPFTPTNPPSSTYWDQYTQNFYDDYSWESAEGNPVPSTRNTANDGIFITASNTAFPYAQPLIQNFQTKGMITGTKTKLIGTGQNLYTGLYYDDKGRLLQSYAQNITGGSSISTTQYSFSGQVLFTYQLTGNNASNQSTGISSRYEYDNLGRLLDIKKSVIPSYITTVAEKMIVKNQYDALGQLQTKILSPAYNKNVGLDSAHYDYNIRGWLLGMNRDYVKDLNATSSFGFDLGYDKNGSLAAYNPQYNGNISGTIWKSKGDQQKRKYDFNYDAVNRLTGAGFNQYVSGTGTAAVFNTSAGVDFTESNISYDANGNLKSYKRMGLLATAASGVIDDLQYSYLNTNGLEYSNKLLNVCDASNDPLSKLGDFKTSVLHPQSTAKQNATTAAARSTIIDYGYDGNGNLTTDYNKDLVTYTGANGIQYNYLNLPWIITVKKDGSSNKGTITYTYDALGNKLRKVTAEIQSSTNTLTTTTDYISGLVFESKVNSTAATTDYTNKLQFGGQEEGRIRALYNNTTSPNTVTDFAFDYFIKDHLGNVRMVLTEEAPSFIYPAATLEGTFDATSNSMVNYEKQFYRIDNTKITPESSIASWVTPAETVANTKLYYNNNGNPPTNINYPSGCTPTQTTGSNNLYKLNATSNKTGLEFMIKVMAGDTINILGKSYYTNAVSITNSNSTALDLATLMTNMLLSPASIPASKGFSAATLTTINTGQVPAGFFRGNNNEASTTVPKAYINYIFLDEQFKYAGGNASRVGTSGSVKDHWTVDPQLQNLIVPKNGYIFVYASNESNLDVFFDNLQVIDKPGPILEETHYYPFGLTMAGISSKAAGKLQNKNKYNGKEEQRQEFSDGCGLEWNDFGARMYDPQIGRWNVVDPMADHPKQVRISPYSAFNNNPIRYVDPTGMIWEDPKEVKKLNKSINSKIENLNKDNANIQDKIKKGGLSEKKLGKLQEKITDNESKMGLLNQSLTDIKTIGEAKETFALTGPSQDDGTHGVLKDSKGVIKIEGSNTGLHLHEIRHVGQSIEAGGTKFNSNGQLLNSATTKAGGRNNEVNAYQTGYSFDGQYPNSASSLKEINQNSLMEIKQLDGTSVYEKLKD